MKTPKETFRPLKTTKECDHIAINATRKTGLNLLLSRKDDKNPHSILFLSISLSRQKLWHSKILDQITQHRRIKYIADKSILSEDIRNRYLEIAILNLCK